MHTISGTVISVEELPIDDSDMYDLTVEDNANYFANGILVHNCHRVDPTVLSSKIMPQLGATAGKLFLIGVAVPVSHVEAALDDPYTLKIVKDWTQCPWLLSDKEGKKILGRTYTLVPHEDGTLHERSVFVLERMPRVIKQELYPHNPTVQYQNDHISIWDFGPGDMDPEDFRVHYMMLRSKHDGAYMSKKELEHIASGVHFIMLNGVSDDIYFAGVDFAGSEADISDFTEISIGRRVGKCVEKVFNEELFGVEYEDQYDIMEELLNSFTGRFKCRTICVDMTGVGLPAVSSLRRRRGMTGVIGVVFSRAHREKEKGKSQVITSGKNMKNTLFDYMKVDGVSSEGFRYPSLNMPIKTQEERNQMRLMSRGLEQWKRLGFAHTSSANKIIKHPHGFNDDIPCADVLLYWAASGRAVSTAAMSAKPRIAQSRAF